MEPNECLLKSHRATPELEGVGKREMCYFYLVLFNMGLLYMKFIKEVIYNSKLAPLSKKNFQIALNESTKINT